jgi:hypothetical protein
VQELDRVNFVHLSTNLGWFVFHSLAQVSISQISSILNKEDEIARTRRIPPLLNTSNRKTFSFGSLAEEKGLLREMLALPCLKPYM